MLNRSSIFTFYVFIFEQDSVVPHIGPSCFHLMGIFNSRRKLRLLRVLDTRLQLTKGTKNTALSKALIKSGGASKDQVTRGVLYAKFLSIRYVIDIFILQDSLINIDIFQKILCDN